MHKVEKLLEELQQIAKLAGGWKTQGEVSNIERELVLDKLKKIYDKVIFMDHITCEQQESAVVEPVAVVEVESVVAVKADSVEPIVEPSTPSVEATAVESTVVPPSPAVEAAPLVVEKTLFEEFVVAPEVEEPLIVEVAFEPEPTEDIEPAPAPEPAEEPTPEPTVESELSRRRVNPEVIRSLYGECALPTSAPQSTSPQQEAATTEASVPTPATTSKPIEVIPSAPIPAPIPTPTSTPRPTPQEQPVKRVLGETIGSGAPAMNEVFAQQHPLHDVASKLRSSAVSQLQSSIGINDRFLLLRDLFGGDMGLYNQTISTLDRCADLDDALIYIQENFDWKPDTEAVNFLVDLLERKFEA